MMAVELSPVRAGQLSAWQSRAVRILLDCKQLEMFSDQLSSHQVLMDFISRLLGG